MIVQPERKWSAVSGLLVSLFLVAFVVPLYAACVIVASEFSLTPEHYLRICHARNVLQWAMLMLQIGSGWLLYMGFSKKKVFFRNFWKLIVVSLVAILSTSILGFVMFNLAEHYWYRTAQRIF